ncbi:HTTM domain-containing protein [Winogradskyella aurantiaca]|uniref:HTTM domain-containing protein n=1 Tax=Winogradskyella aurantiaca TaxID=2219558 RepID=UPI000E1C4A4A|nr:HTTM domain-containing protein [Winogradskyella aurantiaca]
MKSFLFRQIDNSSLIVFRIFFGLLCFLESVGAIFTGWVKRTLIEPEFTFSFIGFEWLQPLPGIWMYIYYVLMGLFGLCIMIGYKYRWTALAFAMMWTATYLMQKSAYNNHYYLLFILSFLMVLLPAHRYKSLDAKFNPKIIKYSMSNWIRWLIIAQLFILYTYASLAKLYPDWLDTSVMAILMKPKAYYPIIGDLLQQKSMHYFIAYGGIVFDGLIIPLLLWKPTRKIAFFSAVFFHLFNSIVFGIGIFPYLALAFSVFFFSPETVNRLFLKSKPLYKTHEVRIPKYASLGTLVLFSYILIHIALPLRHHFFKDNVLWTEEGHRLAWRMMLRSKKGSVYFTIKDKKTSIVTNVNLNDYVTPKQRRALSTKPDFIWQFAQRLKNEYAQKGQEVEVYASSFVSVNGKPHKALIDKDVDLGSVSWDPSRHSEWILPSK